MLWQIRRKILSKGKLIRRWLLRKKGRIGIRRKWRLWRIKKDLVKGKEGRIKIKIRIKIKMLVLILIKERKVGIVKLSRKISQEPTFTNMNRFSSNKNRDRKSSRSKINKRRNKVKKRRNKVFFTKRYSLISI